MDARGVSQSELGRTLGVSHTAVYKWLKNTVPSGDVVSKLAVVFGVNSDELLYGTSKKQAIAKRPPTKQEVEQLFRELPAATQHSLMESIMKSSLHKTEVEVSEEDFTRGWVDAPLEYKLPDMKADFPKKVRIKRLPSSGAMQALAEAIARRNSDAILLPALPEDFLKRMPKTDPHRLLTPFCSFGLVRAAVRINFGDAAADKILRDLGLSYWLDLLYKKEEETF